MPTRKPKKTSAQASAEIANHLLPDIGKFLTPHLVRAIKAEITPHLIKSVKDAIIPTIVEHVTTTIGPDLNTLVSDYVTMLVKKSDETKSAIHQLSKELPSRSPIVVPNSILAPHKDSDSRASRNTPTTSRDHNRRSIHRSRSRSPHLMRYAHSRSPTRPAKSQQKKPPQCALCKKFDHMSKNCNVTTSLSTRMLVMDHENRCMQCFRPLDATHFPTCEPPLCKRGCQDRHGRLERHAEYFCPQNPNLTP